MFINQMKYLSITVVVVCAKLIAACDHANVCKTFPDYYTVRDLNPNCYCNPDAYLGDEQLIMRHGYPVEVHKVVTKDGYILTMFRIPHGKHATGNTSRPPVFIQHGIGLSSMSFYYRGNTSLGFILADQGYDVWLGNFRSTRHSEKHIVLDNNQREYWNFTFHELGMYDMPAQLDYVSNVTRQKIFYIGFSMGTTSFYIYSSEHSDDAASKIRLAISMAPIGALPYLETPIKYILPFWPIVEPFWNMVTNGALIRRKQLTEALSILCLPYPFQMKICNVVISLLFGYDPDQLYPPFEPLVYLQLFDASSSKTLEHYVQLYLSGEFKYFDYKSKNMAIYGTSTPPFYPLQKIKVPNYFIRGKNDLLGTKRNVELLYSMLPERAKPFPITAVKFKKFCHADFVRAKDAKEMLYDHIVDFLQKNGPRFT